MKKRFFILLIKIIYYIIKYFPLLCPLFIFLFRAWMYSNSSELMPSDIPADPENSTDSADSANADKKYQASSISQKPCASSSNACFFRSLFVSIFYFFSRKKNEKVSSPSVSSPSASASSSASSSTDSSTDYPDMDLNDSKITGPIVIPPFPPFLSIPKEGGEGTNDPFVLLLFAIKNWIINNPHIVNIIVINAFLYLITSEWFRSKCRILIEYIRQDSSNKDFTPEMKKDIEVALKEIEKYSGPSFKSSESKSKSDVKDDLDMDSSE